jgi:hypothetical protein
MCIGHLQDKDEVDFMMKRFDLYQTGDISFEEYWSIFSPPSPPPSACDSTLYSTLIKATTTVSTEGHTHTHTEGPILHTTLIKTTMYYMNSRHGSLWTEFRITCFVCTSGSIMMSIPHDFLHSKWAPEPMLTMGPEDVGGVFEDSAVRFARVFTPLSSLGMCVCVCV